MAVPENLSDILRDRIDDRHDTPVVTVLRRFGDRPHLDLNGADLYGMASSMLADWHNAVGRGPLVVALALPHGELFLSALLAGLLGGITLVPVALPRPGLQAERLRHIVRDSGASMLLCSEKHGQSLLEALTAEGRLPPPCPLVCLNDEGRLQPPLCTAPGQPVLGTDPLPALIQYTSGSTRLPKGVRIFPEQILANARLGGDRFGIDKTTRFVNWLPHYHDMGLMGGILYPLLRGGYSVQLGPMDMIRSPAFWLRAISDFRGTMSGGPAFAFAHCLSNVSDRDCASLDLSSWRTAFCGAEPVPADLLPRFRQRFSTAGLKPEAVFACYGLAEFTLFAAGEHEPEAAPAAPEGHADVYPCRLSAQTRAGLAIFDPETRRLVDDGVQGEIWLRGPSMADGYFGQPDETRASFSVRPDVPAGDRFDGPWLRTGDLGLIAGDWLYVTGRIKDTLIAKGRKIAAPELEWLAAGLHDALNPSAAAAFMVAQSTTDNAVLLIERRAPNAVIEDPQALANKIRRAVWGEWGLVLDDVRFLPRGTLDRTSSGKIRRQAVAAAWRDEQARRQPTVQAAEGRR